MGIIDVCPPTSCTGCSLCQQICKHVAITMSADEEGFLHPHIDQNKCVKCGLCQMRCPVKTPLTGKTHKPQKIYSGWSNDEVIRMDSSSGGVFTEIAKHILANGGVVFGVAMDENVTAHHIVVDSVEGLALLRGSKYVQSIVGNAYKEAKSFLCEGRQVLFSGTPCQIAGLRNYLHKDYENLYTVDLICHGVPSPKVFEDYKRYIGSMINERVTSVKFRCKKSSWIFFNMGINPHIEKNGGVKYSYTGEYYSDPWIRAFLRDNILRPNCHQCQYTSTERVADFTIADWWNYKATKPEDKDFDKKGVSLIMCNTLKAVELSDHLDMLLQERTIEEALHTNLSLKRPFPMPKTREEFWKDYRTMPFEGMVRKWMQPERLPLAKWLRIYGGHKIFVLMALLYEKVCRKLRLDSLRIYVKAK